MSRAGSGAARELPFPPQPHASPQWLLVISRQSPCSERLPSCLQPQHPLGVQQAFPAQTFEKCQGSCRGGREAVWRTVIVRAENRGPRRALPTFSRELRGGVSQNCSVHCGGHVPLHA